MIQKRLDTLNAIRRENPCLQRYMTDLLNEMEELNYTVGVESVSKSSNIDRTTLMRLCDAFAVAKMYSEKYDLDISELIEFVSEKTLEILSKDETILTAPFKERIKYLIRQQFPFRNALLSRSGRKNMASYEMCDKYIKTGYVDGNKSSWYEWASNNPELNIPILFTKDPNIIFSEIEAKFEEKELLELLNTQIPKALETLTPREKKVIELRYGFEDGIEHDLEQVGNHFGTTRERIRQIEAKAIRKLHSRKCLKLLCDWYADEHRQRAFWYIKPYKTADDFDSLIYWQPYCICGYQMKRRKNIVIDGEKMTVFCCQSCGRIYRITGRKLSALHGYRSTCHPKDDMLGES